MSFSANKWKQYLKTDAEIPEKPHFAVMLFRDSRFTERGYDAHDPDTTTTVRGMHYYAFPDKETWEGMITAFCTDKYQPQQFRDYDNENIVFFHSGGRGRVEVKIGVNVSASPSR